MGFRNLSFEDSVKAFSAKQDKTITDVVRRVVCAANRSSVTGQMILGPRHWDPVMHVHARLYPGVDFHQQGFIDQFGVFMDRVEARQVAEAANQIVRQCGGRQDWLWSENLY